MIILIVLLPMIGLGQDDYVLEKKQTLPTSLIKKKPLNEKFWLAVSLGGSVNEKNGVPTGFKDSLNNDVNVIINGGSAVTFSLGYRLKEKIDLEVSYNYVASGMEGGYFPNGYGCFERHSLIGVLKYSPFNLNNHKFLLVAGINYVFKPTIKTDFDVQPSNTRIIYNYRRSIGPLFAAEYEFRSKKRISPRIGFKYVWNEFDLIDGTLNGNKIPGKFIDSKTLGFNSSSLFLYFTLAINFEIKK